MGSTKVTILQGLVASMAVNTQLAYRQDDLLFKAMPVYFVHTLS